VIDQAERQVSAGLHAAQQVLHHRRELSTSAIYASSIAPAPSVNAFAFPRA
jgi:hypothetical protein